LYHWPEGNEPVGEQTREGRETASATGG
jgi:hypothetical protein